MTARILVVRRAEAHDAAVWPRALAGCLDVVGAGPWSLDVAEADDALRGAHGLPPPANRYDGVIMTADVTVDDDPVPSWWSTLAGVAELALAFVVTTHPGWGSATSDAGIAQFSFLRVAEGFDDATFREHYRAHVALARVHMGAAVCYRQHDVEASHGAGAGSVRAVSEMRWATAEDVRERYWSTPASPVAFVEHEAWLDRRRTSTLFTTARLDGPR